MLVKRMEICYYFKAMAHWLSGIWVWLGRGVVRFFLLCKAGLLWLVDLVWRGVFAPFGRALLFVAVPLYRLISFFQRRFSLSRRPIKNKLLFFVGNKFVPLIVLFVVVIFSVFSNIHLRVARAEVAVSGERSILYALLTHRQIDLVEDGFVPEEASAYVADASDDVALLFFHPQVFLSQTDFLDDEAVLSGLSAVSDGGAAPTVPTRTGIITYAVQSGDTLSGIAQKFGISLQTLLWANGMTSKSVLAVGKELTILPVSGVQHTVKSGDSLLAIAKKYNVSAAEIAKTNALSDAGSLRVGQQLMIPGGSPLSTVTSRTSGVAVRDVFVQTPSTSSPKPAGGAGMIWPSDGRYIVRKLSWFHTGYDIDCNGHRDGESTDDNYAAADGVVSYAGWRSGYGNTVEIDHGNGIKTRYGHHYALYVHTGDVVSQGTPIGRCGSTGTSTGTHLHFEVISGGKFLNPGDYLP